MKNSKKITAYCPSCEKYHDVYSDWTGRGVPRIICKGCATLIFTIRRNIGYRTFTKKKPTTFLSILETRGLTREQKLEHDSDCEFRSWKERRNNPVRSLI